MAVVAGLQQPMPTTANIAAVHPTAPMARPTNAPTSKLTTGGHTVVSVTHGTPHLGGQVSDFYGRYGTDTNGVQVNGDGTSSVGWLIDPNNADGGYLILVHYGTTSHVVNFLSYNGPSSWSKAQYRDYLIATWAPPGYASDTSANQYWTHQGGDPYNPIAYTSNIGKFFLHISDGNGWMNTL